ncbi:putative ABC transporter permease [Candidatus Saccharibacteria bacterium]|nr:putative ABC transporter permease [Candidatus Saccharibacteria bacterium]
MIANLFLCFIVYSFGGWFWESAILSLGQEHRFINRGFLNGPICPIYGLGALIAALFSQIVGAHYVQLFFLSGIAACTLEYITSFALEKLFHARWWDYHDRFLHLNGRICLAGFILFGLASVGISIIHPYVYNFIEGISWRNTLAIIIAVLLVADIFTTAKSINRFNKTLREFQAFLNRGRIIQFISRGKKVFIGQLEKGSRKILTYPQRRLMRAFPNYKSYYDKAYGEVKKLYESSKYKPKQTAHARKKTQKIVK